MATGDFIFGGARWCGAEHACSGEAEKETPSSLAGREMRNGADGMRTDPMSRRGKADDHANERVQMPKPLSCRMIWTGLDFGHSRVDPATKTVRIYREWQLDSSTPSQSKHIDQVSFTFPDLKAGDRLYESGWTCTTIPADVLTVTDYIWYRLVDPSRGAWEPAQGYAKEGETYAIRLEAVAFNEYKGDKSTKILIDGGPAFFTDSRIVGATHVIATCRWALPAQSGGGDEPAVTPESDTPANGSNIPATGDSSMPFVLAAFALLGACGTILALRRMRA